MTDSDAKYVENDRIIRVDHERWLLAQQYEKKTWDENFQLCDDWNSWWKKRFEDYSLIEEHLRDKKNISIIEVGCGPFTNVRLIESVLSYSDIKKITLSDPLLESYKKIPCHVSSLFEKNPSSYSYDFFQEQLEYLSHKDESFDLLICINVLDHVEDVTKCISEMKRVLKKDGLIVFGNDLTDWTKRKDPSPDGAYDQGHMMRINEEFVDESFSSFEPLMRKIVESRNPEYHYGCVCFIGKKNN